MQKTVDCAILGAGLVGLALALALARQRQVALVEANPPRPFTPSSSYDSRVYAISPVSSAWLQDLNVWQHLDSSRVAPIWEMAISGDGGGYLEFSNLEAGRPYLGHIVESGHLQQVLWQQVQANPNIHCFVPAQAERLVDDLDKVILHLDTGDSIAAHLLVGADGSNSWLRQQRRLEAWHKGYGESGVVANFAVERPHGNVARQWFAAPGVLAWLPLPNQRISMVWSLPNPQAEQLLALSPAALADTVAAAGANILGRLDCLTPVRCFPLSLLKLSRTVAHRSVLVGDAAHQVHPLAGQGVNLGFDDARVLVGLLLQQSGQDPGNRQLLQAYDAVRRRDVRLMQLVTDGLHSLFAPPSAPLAWLRNHGLNLTDRQKWLKRQLINHAVGEPLF